MAFIHSKEPHNICYLWLFSFKLLLLMLTEAVFNQDKDYFRDQGFEQLTVIFE